MYAFRLSLGYGELPTINEQMSKWKQKSTAVWKVTSNYTFSFLRTICYSVSRTDTAVQINLCNHFPTHLLLTTPPVNGEMMPIASMASGIHRPRWCFRRRQKAISVAPMWMNSEENKAHKNTEYQISETDGQTVGDVNKHWFDAYRPCTGQSSVHCLHCLLIQTPQILHLYINAKIKGKIPSSRQSNQYFIKFVCVCVCVCVCCYMHTTNGCIKF